MSENPSHEHDEIIQKYDRKMQELENLYQQKAKGAMIRSKVQWYEEGEKSTSFFLNLESQQQSKSTIHKIVDTKTQKEITSPHKIMSEIKHYYKTLYSEHAVSESPSFLQNNTIPQISEEDLQNIDKPITEEECYKTIQTFSINKSPGNDGLTIEFYQQFWKNIKTILIKTYHEAAEDGEFSTSQKQSVIKLINKKNKDKTLLTNWRPLSLMNVDMKIFCKTIAIRLKNIMPKIIHYNQSAFVQGRYIGDNIRTIDDIMYITKTENKPGILIAIDFEKAFDTLSHSYIWTTLESFGFSKNFINLLRTVYRNITSCVMNNSYSTGYFQVNRGVRQGDPLSPYLFIMAIEILCIKIRQDEKIEGIKIHSEEVKLSLFADDLTAFIKTIKSARHLFEILENFRKCSGLKFNFQKTEAIGLGSTPKSDIHKINIKVPSGPIKIVGIFFSQVPSETYNGNFTEKILKIKKLLNVWRQRGLTLIGKIQIIKSLIIPIVMFTCANINTPPHFLQDINQIVYNFLWNGKDKVKRNVLIQNQENGGMKMIDISSMINAQYAQWVKRYFINNHHTWKLTCDHILKDYGGGIIFKCNFDIKNIKPCSVSPFYLQVINAWHKIYNSKINNSVSFEKQMIWNNQNIKLGGKSVYFSSLSHKGINLIEDLLDESNGIADLALFSKEDFSTIDIFKIAGLQSQIVKSRQMLQAVEENRADNTDIIQVELNGLYYDLDKLTSKTIYKHLVNTKKVEPTAQERWSQEFKIKSDEWKIIYNMPKLCTIETRLRSFQYKILHRILYTNDKLFRFGKSETTICTFCNSTIETVDHLLYYCLHSQIIWMVNHKWLEDKINTNSLFSKQNIIFGIIKKSAFTNENHWLLVNHLILITKYYLYKTKICNKIPVISGYQKYVQNAHQIELIIAKKNNRLDIHNDKWGLIMDNIS